MNTNDLKIFEAVAVTGSFTRAAEAVHTVQSNVTARIRALEEEFGAVLFERNSKMVRLTPEGEKLLPFARRIDTMIAEARAEIASEARVTGTLRIGSLETTAALRLPPIVAAYAAACPEVELRLTARTTGELVNDVLAARLDGAFVAGPVASDLLEQQVVVREELVLVTPPSIGSLRELPREGAALKVIVFKRSCAYRQRLETFLGGRGIMNYSLIEFGGLEGIIGFVRAGIGVTILPRAVVELYGMSGGVAIHALPREIARVDTLFIRRKDLPPSRALRAFVQELQKPKP